MPPEMVINQVTGFLDRGSANSFATFDSGKKLKFLELADNYRKETGKWPDIGDLCEAVGTSLTTFYRQLNADPQFKAAWDERLLRGEARLTSKLHDASHPIAQLAWLRRHFPQRWNPEYKVTTEVSHTFVESLGDRAKAVDADVSPAIAPQIEASPSSQHILSKDIEGGNPA